MQHCNCPRVTATEGSATASLRDTLMAWGIPLADCVSPLWQCRIVGAADSDVEVLANVLSETPVMVPEALGAPVAALVGADGLDYVCRPEWGPWIHPKIAFVGGWGEPGSLLVDDSGLAMVTSFADVICSPRRLNLQMFQRGAGADAVTGLPPIPTYLQWPLPTLFAEQAIARDTFGHVVDMATRVSSHGAFTWWHLDDCGEFTYQVGLPCSPARHTAMHAQGRRGLIGPGGKPVVKLFFFVQKGAYDLITQDSEVNKSGLHVGLDFFQTHTSHLPHGAELPVVSLALLEAGGRPLLSPPNVMHCVLTMQDCVMVEQRRLSLLFCDEICYFLKRAERWREPPILYDFLARCLQEEFRLTHYVVVPLLRFIAAETTPTVFKRRAMASLRTLLANKRYFALPSTLEARVVLACAPLSQSAPDLVADVRLLADAAAPLDAVPPGVSCVRVAARDAYAAVVHHRGRPRWGPPREHLTKALEDRRVLAHAVVALGAGESVDAWEMAVAGLSLDALSVAAVGNGEGGLFGNSASENHVLTTVAHASANVDQSSDDLFD